MAIFVYIGHDGPKGAELRATDTRTRHLEHLSGLDAQGIVRFAGPLKTEAGAPCGSMVVIEAESHAAARALAERDPYSVEGVFEHVDVFETAQAFPEA